MGKIMTLFCFSILVVLSCAASEPITPLPKTLADIDWVKAKIGKELFNDPILSVDRTVSYASCHDIFNAGVLINEWCRLALGIKKATFSRLRY